MATFKITARRKAPIIGKLVFYIPLWGILLVAILSGCSSASPSIPVSNTSTSTPNLEAPSALTSETGIVSPTLSGLATATSSYPPTATPAACTPKGTIDRLQVLNIDPPIGTTMKIGGTYFLRVQVQIQLVTWPQAYLQLLLYQFNNGSEEHASLNTVKVMRGCEIREISLLIDRLQDGGQSAMKPMVILRWDNAPVVYDRTLLTPYKFLGSYPVSR
jgi:hypothetical protein